MIARVEQFPRAPRGPLSARGISGPLLFQRRDREDLRIATAATDPQLSFIFKRPFDEQVAFFRGKLGNLVPTRTWRDLLREQHDRGFMVAGAAKADLLADLAGAIDKAVSEGETIDAFRKRFRDIVRQHGWHGWTGEGTKAGEAWRTRVIYETNLATSYSAGRLAQLKQGAYPYWMYKHSDVVQRPRPQHVAWDGLVLPVEHEFWQTHFPPNGWGCKCRVVGVRSPRQAKRLGGDPDKALPAGWNTRDAKGRLPGIDEGWNYQPGRSNLENFVPREADDLSPVRASSKAPEPLPPPRTAPASRLLPEGRDPEFYARAFLDEFGATLNEISLFQDAAGEYIAIGAALFQGRSGAWKSTKRGRERYSLLLADTLRSPDEIRMGFDDKANRLRRRYIARWQVEGTDVPALVVFEWSRDAWVGVTAFTPDDFAYLERRGRLGEVVWRRESDE